MAKVVYRQMPTPRELPQQINTPGQKLGWKSPRVGQSFGGLRGGWLWQKLIAALWWSAMIIGSKMLVNYKRIATGIRIFHKGLCRCMAWEIFEIRQYAFQNKFRYRKYILTHARQAITSVSRVARASIGSFSISASSIDITNVAVEGAFIHVYQRNG